MEPSIDSISQLVRQAQLGDGQAFSRLVEPDMERLVRLASAILGNETDAKDAIQEALAISWRQIRSLRHREKFRPWVTRILINECKSLVRKRSNGRVRETRIGDGMASEPSSPSVEDRFVSYEALDRAFERLNVSQRAVLALHHLELQPIDEIAFAMGVPSGTVKSRLFAARRALQEALTKEDRDGLR